MQPFRQPLSKASPPFLRPSEAHAPGAFVGVPRAKAAPEGYIDASSLAPGAGRGVAAGAATGAPAETKAPPPGMIGANGAAVAARKALPSEAKLPPPGCTSLHDGGDPMVMPDFEASPLGSEPAGPSPGGGPPLTAPPAKPELPAPVSAFGASTLGMAGMFGRAMREAPLKAGLPASPLVVAVPEANSPPSPQSVPAQDPMPVKILAQAKKALSKSPPVMSMLVKGAPQEGGAAPLGEGLFLPPGQVNVVLSLLSRGMREAPMKMPPPSKPMPGISLLNTHQDPPVKLATQPSAMPAAPSQEDNLSSMAPPAKAPPAAFGAIGAAPVARGNPEAKAPPEALLKAPGKAPPVKLQTQLAAQDAPPAKSPPSGPIPDRAPPEVVNVALDAAVRVAPVKQKALSIAVKAPSPTSSAGEGGGGQEGPSAYPFGSGGFGGLAARGEFGRAAPGLEEAAIGGGMSQLWKPQILQHGDRPRVGGSREAGPIGSAIGSERSSGSTSAIGDGRRALGLAVGEAAAASEETSSGGDDGEVARAGGLLGGILGARELGLDPSAPEWFPPGAVQTAPAPAAASSPPPASQLPPAPGLSLLGGREAPAPAERPEPPQEEQQPPTKLLPLAADGVVPAEGGRSHLPPPEAPPPAPPQQDPLVVDAGVGEFDVEADHPVDVLKSEILRQREEIATLRQALARAEAELQRWPC